LVACHSSTSTEAPAPGGGEAPRQSVKLSITARDTTFVTRDHFMASVEMQLAGEPLAEAMGRDLKGFTRDFVCQETVCSPDIYYEMTGDGAGGSRVKGRTDLAGFASAVESYEYSKQAMNNLAFESGAGTSLAFGLALNPERKTGSAALAGLREWVQHLAIAASTDASVVSATASPTNPLGWPGLWPTLLPFTSWDPHIAASNQASTCAISSDDNPGVGSTPGATLNCNDYECDATSLHLPGRDAQTNHLVGPGASGWAGWKEALWAINYLQVMHDTNENPVASVPEEQLALVGTAANEVTGGEAAGVYLGSSRIEGFQAGNFLQIADNAAAEWLTALSTTDGVTLSGFASVAEALAYSDSSPLRWFPGSVRVTEQPDDSGFPRVAGHTIDSPDSNLLDAAGLIGAYASFYSLTDLANKDVGGSQPVRAYFDGDPFPTQDQTPSGASTLHDRALAMVRVSLVNLVRLHVDPASGLLVDDVKLASGQPVRGSILSADHAAYALQALRTARRALGSQLTLYGNTRPDVHGVETLIDAPPLDGQPLGARLDALLATSSAVFQEKLTTPEGKAFGGWNLATNTPTDDGSSLDAHTAAIKGLLLAYLATGNTTHRDRARAVFARLDAAFYDPAARIYRERAADQGTTVTFTTRRFGLLQGALRDMYELVATLPGEDALASLIEARIARLDKLVLNGWDDADEDQNVLWPDECAQLGQGPDGKPLGLGGLQMGERVLTGESGSLDDQVVPGKRVVTTDRERDCVPEISAVGLPAALASSVTFTLTPAGAR
jgi:hypothetical protein